MMLTYFHDSISGMLQMLMDTDLDATQQDYAQTAKARGKSLITLINEVLDQAKIESGNLELEEFPFDLQSILDYVLSLFSGKTRGKGIEVCTNCSITRLSVPITLPIFYLNPLPNFVYFLYNTSFYFVPLTFSNQLNNGCVCAPAFLWWREACSICLRSGTRYRCWGPWVISTNHYKSCWKFCESSFSIPTCPCFALEYLC